MIHKLWMIIFVGTVCVASDSNRRLFVSYRHDPYAQDLSVARMPDENYMQCGGRVYRLAPGLVQQRRDVKQGSVSAVIEIYKMFCNSGKLGLGFAGIERSALENLISNDAACFLKIDGREDCIKAIVSSIPGEQRHAILNTHNACGQTIAHKLTPVHWYRPLVVFLINSGLDVTAPTIEPDIFIGSTLAHNVAALLQRGNACGYSHLSESAISGRRKRALDCLVTLWHVDQGKHFNHLSGRKRTKVMDLIPLDVRDEFIEHLHASE